MFALSEATKFVVTAATENEFSYILMFTTTMDLLSDFISLERRKKILPSPITTGFNRDSFIFLT